MDIRQILELAAEKEQEAADLYAGMARDAGDTALRALLEGLAAEEHRHKELLLGVDPSDVAELEPEEQQALGLAEYLTIRPPSGESRLQDALTYAIRREQHAGDFYRRMADAMHDEDLRELFGQLAAMERGHQARLEEMYESVFLPES